MIQIILSVLAFGLGLSLVPLAGAVLYLLGLTAAAAVPRRPVAPARRLRTFRVVIPAHDEELVLEPVLRRLLTLDYPRTHFEVVVVADNCSDQTADVARTCGVRVLERADTSARGKGHALDYAFRTLQPEDFDAYIVLDADTLVDRELLNVFNRYLADGQRIIQAHYDVLDPFVNQRTALMYVAFMIFNYVRPLGRRALGLSTGLKGNGMCFDKTVIDTYAWNAYSLAEDIEYTTQLLVNGERIVFAPEAHIQAQMPMARQQATTQRIRWEAGRLQMARRDGLRLVWQGIRMRNAQVFDWGMDLVIPPLTALALMLLGGTSAALLIALLAATPGAQMLLSAWAAAIGGLLLFVLAAMIVGQLPWAAYNALLSAPKFVLWKLWVYVVMATRRAPQTWIRTERTQLHDR